MTGPPEDPRTRAERPTAADPTGTPASGLARGPASTVGGGFGPRGLSGVPRSVGPYQVVREVGRGGMGIVLEVRHPAHPERALALKLILGDPGELVLARFAREAELMARVRHTNVVQVHQLGRADEGPYLVTDLVVGRGLERAAREGLEPLRAAAIVRTLADALAAVHAQGILHRDLKPANVILRAPDDAPVLLDFGVSRDQTAERLTATGVSVGTPNYMSPEQASGARPDTIDVRTDVYGLGAILFELLAGRPPHEGDSPFATLRKVIVEEPRWPSADRPDLPWPLEAVLRKAMARERMFRYRSAEALRDDLDRVLRDERPEAAEAFGPRRRGRVLVAVGAAAVVAGLSVAGVVHARRRAAAVAPTTTTATVDAPADAPPPRPARPTWAARVAAQAGTWPDRPHVTLRHARHQDKDKPHVLRARFLPDGRVVSVCRISGTGNARTLRVWSLPGEGDVVDEPDLELPLPALEHEEFDLDVSADGRVLVCSSRVLGHAELGPAPRFVRWDVATPAENLLANKLAARGDGAFTAFVRDWREPFRCRSTIVRVEPSGAFTPLFELPFKVQGLDVLDGRLAVISTRGGVDETDPGEGVLALWELEAGKLAREPVKLPLFCWAVALRPGSNGRLAAVGKGGGFLDLVDPVTGEVRELTSDGTQPSANGGTSSLTRASAHSQAVNAVVFEADGARLWSAGGRQNGALAKLDGELRAWDGRDAGGAIVEVPGRTRPPGGSARAPEGSAVAGFASIEVSPDGRALVVGDDRGAASVWIIPPRD